MMFSTEYSSEEINLYNPSYVGGVIYQAVRESQYQNKEGLHCTLPYLIVPLALSTNYLSILPKAISSPMADWATNYEGELVGFSESVIGYIDIVNSAITFLLARDVIGLSREGLYIIPSDHMAKMPAYVASNLRYKQSFLAAGFLGRWFASASSVESIYTHLGVKP